MFKNLEIRVLICKRDIIMGLNMVKSLRRYPTFKSIPVFFHNDGSLDDESKNILLSIDNSYIVDRGYADTNILDLLNDYSNCKKYRFEPIRIFDNTKLKLFDFYLLSESKNILCIDCDVLFLNQPSIMVELIHKSIPFYFPDFQNSYSFCKTTQANVLEKVNTGIVYIPSKEYYNIDSIEFALNDLFSIGISINPHWIEQSAYAHMFYKHGRYVSLDEEKYKIPRPDITIPVDVESLHFVGHPPIRRMYDDFLKREYL